MKEIKFRAWINQEERMNYFQLSTLLDGYGNDCPYTPNGERPFIDKNNLIMQYTGLHDKNGKEIYEGDIVKADAFYLGDSFVKASTGQVRFDNGAYFVSSEVPTCGELDSEAIFNYRIEIIGNIYENPELLEAKA